MSIEKVGHDMQPCVILHVATNLTNLLCKNLRERSTPQRESSQLSSMELTDLTGSLYSQKAPSLIFD